MRSTTLLSLMFFALVHSAFAESCWQSTAQRYGIHTAILRATAITESAMNVYALNRNTNGSEDVGLMQINDRWFPQLARMGIQPEDLWDGYTNLEVAAWVLAG